MNNNKQLELNGNDYDYRGTGYTRAFILVDRMRDDKFIGYIPTKDEYVIATKFTEGGYGWSEYFMNLEDLLKHLESISLNSYSKSVLDFIDYFKLEYNRQIAMNKEAI